jgi:hypothetical protein
MGERIRKTLQIQNLILNLQEIGLTGISHNASVQKIHPPL